MSAHELILAAAVGAVCLAVSAVFWAFAQRRVADRRVAILNARVRQLELGAETAQASVEAFDSALLAVEDGRALLASGEESLAVCSVALGLAETDAQAVLNALMRADPDHARSLRALFERGEACAFEVKGPAGVVTVEGRAAGAWTIGVAATGNALGLSVAETAALPFNERLARFAAARQSLQAAGADYVVEAIGDCGPTMQEIFARVQRGERAGAAARS